jgi:hypothetical protein
VAYQRLAGIDTAFLLAESETTPLRMLAAIMLDLHIRRAALPRPGGREELCSLASEQPES